MADGKKKSKSKADDQVRDLDALSLAELKQLRADVEAAIRSAEVRARQEALAAAKAAAEEHGFALNDVLGSASKGKGRTTAPKYRHPENPALTWSGRGRRPKWVTERLDAGASLDALSI